MSSSLETAVAPVSCTLGSRPRVWPSARLGQLRDSTALMGDACGLQARLEADGYLLLRGLIDPAVVRAGRAALIGGLMERGAVAADGTVHERALLAGAHERALADLPALRAVVEHAAVAALMGDLLGTPALRYQHTWLRAVGAGGFTGAHVDAVYMGRGSSRVLTCWTPYGDIGPELGSLAVLEGSHRLPGYARIRATYGRLDVDRDHAEGWLTSDPDELEQLGGRWLTTRFAPGDVIVFGLLTLHMSTANTTGQVRLSTDTRWQPADEAMDPRWSGAAPSGHEESPMPKRRMGELRAQWGI